jgi:hypothetical protein
MDYKGCKVEIVNRSGSIPLWVGNWRITDESDMYKEESDITIWIQKDVYDAIKAADDKQVANAYLDEILEHEYREANIAIDMAKKIIDESYPDAPKWVINHAAEKLIGDAHDKLVAETHGSAKAYHDYNEEKLKSLGLDPSKNKGFVREARSLFHIASRVASYKYPLV